MWLKSALCGVAAVLMTSTVLAATPESVAEAIEKGRQWLLSQQNDAGNWETTPAPQKPEPNLADGGQWGGLTALSTYALLASGESVQNPKLRSAVEFLKRADMQGIYAIGLRSQVWQFLPQDPDVRACIDRDAKLLLDGVLSTQDNTGLFNYLTPAAQGDTRVDHSVSQYGVLGIWALEKAGAEIPPKFWEYVENTWVSHQDPSGGWCYIRSPDRQFPVTIAMTAAGVATLFITQDYLHSDEGIQPRGNITRPEIESGMQWIADNFDSVGENWYAWYGIERIGVASGLKYFGPHNWYEHGADLMVSHQQGDGHWEGWFGGQAGSTSFCLLFLARGRAPVMMSKLQYDIVDPRNGQTFVGPWNQRPRDIANLTRWVGQHTERELNWQIVNLRAPVEELADTPVLYLSGSGQLNLSDADKAKLKEYIENGGIVVANPDGGKLAFTEAFKKLGQSMFPAYSFRELPEKHVIYTGQQFHRSRSKVKFPIQALGNGAREMMVALPSVDLARQWQIYDTRKREEAFQLMANLYLYSVDKQLQYKGERTIPKPDPAITADRTISVARLQYDGNWDPEPGGWRRMQTLMHNRHEADLQVTAAKLGAGQLDTSFSVAHLTGTEAIKLSPAQRQELKRYVEQGGVLIVDAAGGQSAVRTAIEAELASIFGAESGKAFANSLPPDNALYAALGDAATAVEYRNFTMAELGRLPKEPLLRGIQVNGKYRVIYSPFDLSVGLVGQNVDGIFGYSPRSATDLMAGLLLYASR